jgi:hypothetical protein
MTGAIFRGGIDMAEQETYRLEAGHKGSSTRDLAGGDRQRGA